MNNLILVRHGQSIFNLKHRFTGFYDIGLTSNGESEALHAGELIKKLNIQFDAYFTSQLIRASNSLNIILEVLNISNAIDIGETHADHNCIIDSSNKIKCWGAGIYGQLGNASSSNSSIPVNVIK